MRSADQPFSAAPSSPHPRRGSRTRYREVRGWEWRDAGYYVDQWAPEVLSRRPSAPLLQADGCPASAQAFSDQVANFDQIASVGVHLHDRSEVEVRLTSNGLLASPTSCSPGGGRIQLESLRCRESIRRRCD